ncbi:MAG: hypothetical protein QJR12_03500 [Mycobacterium sp.]|uniref:hypothetical protein n=1 Tax=Mycobacterium sp. TaxID=1785 RepID=UPI002610F752|nr:hypothetical protein [Mycobacterium sp.]MDI3313370.1 hypothetical protein [Mycobacterium sp.]
MNRQTVLTCALAGANIVLLSAMARRVHHTVKESGTGCVVAPTVSGSAVRALCPQVTR